MHFCLHLIDQVHEGYVGEMWYSYEGFCSSSVVVLIPRVGPGSMVYLTYVTWQPAMAPSILANSFIDLLLNPQPGFVPGHRHTSVPYSL